MAGAGQGHVEFAEILPESLVIGPGQHRLVGRQGEVAPALVVVPGERQVAGLLLAEGADEGQEDQRVLEPLGLVDGDHLHQVGVALQAQAVGVGLGRRVGASLAEVAQQGVLAVELGAGLLQQLAQVQQVRQVPLAAGALQKPGGHGEVRQQPVQHGQHALALPLAVVGPELQHPLFPGQLVVLQGIEVVISHAQAGHGQGGMQATLAVGLGAGGQPHLQFQGRRGLEDALLVGEIDAADAALEQCAAYRPGLARVVDQHGEIRGLERAEGLVGFAEAGAALLALAEQLGHSGGAARGHLLEIDALAELFAWPLGLAARWMPAF